MFSVIAGVTQMLLFLAIALSLPSLCQANSPYNGSANLEQLIEKINSDPSALQQAKTFLLTNYPQIAQTLKYLPMFFSGSINNVNEDVTPKKVPPMIGKARGTISRNLRPLNPPITTNTNSDADTDNTISITPGREFTHQALWNTWVDGYYFDVSDRRYNLTLDGHESLVTFGADRLIRDNFALGLLLSFQYAHSTNFRGNWIVNSDEVTIGPYFAYQMSPRWVLSTSLAYSNETNKLNIGTIGGKYIAESGSLEVDAAGQYNYKVTNVRYKSSFYYAYIHNNAYNITGTSARGNAHIPVASDSFGIGLINFLIEINKDFRFNRVNVFEPFAELGVTYQYLRPNNGKILTGNLLLVTPSPWSGLARLGARLQINQSLYTEANVAYLSIGQPGLNIWQGRLYISYSF